MSTYIPWKQLILIAAIAGIFWPLPYLVSPVIGLFFTVMLAGAAGLFLMTLPPTSEMLSFGSYILTGLITGTTALVMALVTLTILCNLSITSQNHMCTARAGLGGFVIVGFGLYLFILLMLYWFMR